MFGLGLPELAIILVILMIVFGVGKLPQIGEGMGKAIRGLKRELDGSPEEPVDPDHRPADRKL